MRLGAATLLASVLIGLAGHARAELLFATAGTGTLLHPLQEPTDLSYPSCYYDGPCQWCKEHVYIFGINGLNPMCLGNFNGMLSYVRKNGFEKTQFGQMYTCSGYANLIRQIRQRDPDAKIVLIGFSLGANSVRTVANHLNKDGTKVDLLIYLVGDFIYNTPDSFPPNVCKVVNVRAKGLVLCGGDLLFNGEDIDRAVNHKLDCRHILVPSRRETLKLVMEELLILACVPQVDVAPEELPAPQARVVAPSTQRPVRLSRHRAPVDVKRAP
jgi:hypothetical protein